MGLMKKVEKKTYENKVDEQMLKELAVALLKEDFTVLEFSVETEPVHLGSFDGWHHTVGGMTTEQVVLRLPQGIEVSIKQERA